MDRLVEALDGNHKAMRALHLGIKAPLVGSRERLTIAYMLGMGVTDSQDVAFGCKLQSELLFILLELFAESEDHTLQDLATQLGGEF